MLAVRSFCLKFSLIPIIQFSIIFQSSISLPFSIPYANLFSNLLCIKSIESPNKIAETISKLLIIPSTEKDIRINIVEIINPEFRITL